jgi:uncharacterized protein YjdB
MAIDTITITIVNANKQPKILGEATINPVVISPTPITTPDTPYTEYVADSLTISDGSIQLPLWNRDQFTRLPASSKLIIETDDYSEAAYYATLAVDGATITLSDNPLTIVSVKFDKTKATVAVGDTVAITATTNPTGETVTWTSSDETVATVSGGTVTGKVAGTATITGTITVDGIEATAICEVTVE